MLSDDFVTECRREFDRDGSTDAFKTLGFWRRNGWRDAFLERRWDKEPGPWERVTEEVTTDGTSV